MQKITKLLLVLAVCFSIKWSNAQDYNNYFNTGISCVFLGTGDLLGSSLNLNYTYMPSKKFGIKASYALATAGHSGTLDTYKRNQITNVITEGDGGFLVDYAKYDIVNIGAVYQINDGLKHILHTSAGVTYKRIKSTRPGAIWGEPNDNGEHVFTIKNYYYSSRNAIGFFINFEYLYFIKENFSIGIRAASQPVGDVVYSIGISLGSRF